MREKKTQHHNKLYSLFSLLCCTDFWYSRSEFNLYYYVSFSCISPNVHIQYIHILEFPFFPLFFLWVHFKYLTPSVCFDFVFVRLADKVSVITGGARGIGAATAKLFAENGAHVVIADILDDLGTTLAESIGGKYVHCDVTKESDVESAVDVALKWKGRLDIMFNNAGVSGPFGGSVARLKMETVRQVVEVNVMGILHGIKFASRAMINANVKGSIICTSSTAGKMGGLGSHAYTLSKEAINGLVRSVACELGVHGIRVNSISPHGIPTQMLVHAFRRFTGNDDMKPDEVADIVSERGSLLRGRGGVVDDVAAAALFLASEDSGFVTAHNLVVDGGYTGANSDLSFIYR